MPADERRPFVPDDFVVPTELSVEGFRLVPLGPQHNEADHAAWMSSIEHIRATPGFVDRDWPKPMSLEQNRTDLVRHADDFAARIGFTYTVLDEGGTVIGCVYVYPPQEQAAGGVIGADAEVRSWVSAAHADRDADLYRVVSGWLGEAWPFRQVRYAPRAADG